MNNFGPCAKDCPNRKAGCSASCEAWNAVKGERLKSYGRRAEIIDIDKNKSSLWTFQRVGGAPRNWTHIKTFRDEIVELSEVPALLKKYGLISEEDTL